MKVQFAEYNGCFNINLEPENKEETIQLVRLGINKTKELRGIYVDAYNNKTLEASIVIGKKKNPITQVGRIK